MSNISDILITLGRLARGHDYISKINLDHDSSKKLADYIYQKNQEIKRLNDIINELEIEFDSVIKDPLIHMCYKRLAIKYADKLQELKGSNSNENL